MHIALRKYKDGIYFIGSFLVRSNGKEFLRTSFKTEITNGGTKSKFITLVCDWFVWVWFHIYYPLRIIGIVSNSVHLVKETFQSPSSYPKHLHRKEMVRTKDWFNPEFFERLTLFVKTGPLTKPNRDCPVQWLETLTLTHWSNNRLSLDQNCHYTHFQDPSPVVPLKIVLKEILINEVTRYQK